ncbi:MAG: hypothetical protein ACFFDN_32555 [Candidatus Hodarchaeota archaeon]
MKFINMFKNQIISLINLLKTIYRSQNTTVVINLILSAFLVLFARSALELNKSIQKKEDSIRIAQKYNIALETIEFLIEYINYCVEFIVRGGNTILIIDPNLSEQDSIINYIWFDSFRRSLEVESFLGHKVITDLMGDEVAQYIRNKPYLYIDVFGVLNENEIKAFLALQRSIYNCTNLINSLLKRFRDGYIATIKVYLKKENIDKIPKDRQFNPVISHIYKNWLNQAKYQIEDIRHKSNTFLSLFNSIGIDTLKFVLQVESNITFSERGALGNTPDPRELSIIKLDSVYYEFDYFNYFINKKDTVEWSDNNGVTTWYNRIN